MSMLMLEVYREGIICICICSINKMICLCIYIQREDQKWLAWFIPEVMLNRANLVVIGISCALKASN